MRSYQNILIVNPRPNYHTEKEIYPSGALVLLGTMLQKKGYNVKLVHMVADRVGPSQLRDIITSFKPDVVGISMSTFQTKSAREVSQIVKEVNRDTLVVAGGPHPSALKQRIFESFPQVDVVVIGEGEFTFMDIVEGKDLESIPGVCYKGKMNPPRPLAENLDYIPLPNLDLVDISRFVGPPPPGPLPILYVMASRGCPFGCTFCNKSVWGAKTRFRRPEMVIEEVKWLHEKYGAREIFFQDDTFNLNRQWAEQIFKLIIENGLNKKMIFRTPFRANRKLVDEELLRMAREAGFWLIFYGVENGNQGMLNSMSKGLTIEEIKRAFEMTHRVGLKTNAAFIIGMPGETRETIRDTINLWRELKPYHQGFSPAIPLPESEFERIVLEKNHLLTRNYDEYDPDKFIVRTDALTAEELERYSEIISGLLVRRRLARLLAPRHILAMTWDSIRRPGSLISRFKTLYGLLKSFSFERDLQRPKAT